MSYFKELIGCNVQSISINEDGNAIKFESHGISYIYVTSGDCCACIYFEDIEYPAVKPTDGWHINEISDHEDYGVRLKTRDGDIVISGRYSDNSGWGGYGVECNLYAIILEEMKEFKWSQFKEKK